MLGALGQPAGPDGKVWKNLPANSSGIDVTPHVPGAKSFKTQPTALPSPLHIIANGTDTFTGFPPAQFCVGQHVKFQFSGIPSGYTATNILWSLPETYVTDSTNAFPGASYPNCSINYFLNTNSLAGAEVDAWWVSGGSPAATYSAKVTCDLLQDGQIVASASGDGNFYMSKPDIAWTGTKTGQVAFGVPYEDSLGRTNFLHFGYFVAASNQPGVSFEIRTNSYWGYPGTFIPIQIIDSSADACGTNGITQHISGNGLDEGIGQLATYPFDNARYWDDPAIGCENDNRRVWKSGFFHTYWTFQPDDPGSIRVPVKLVTWNWHGIADNGGGWHLDFGGSAGNVTGSDLEPDGFPTWTNVVHKDLRGYTSYTNSSCEH